MHNRIISIPVAAGALLVASSVTYAQSFALDNESPFGFGAENPFGLPYPQSFVPSPSLAPISCLDSDLLCPNPAPGLPPMLNTHSPNGLYDDSLSGNAWEQLHTYSESDLMRFRFSVDRLSIGAPLTALREQSDLQQHPADIFVTTDWFRSPVFYIGRFYPAGGYAGQLVPLAHLPGAMGNGLLIDESLLDLQAGNAIVGPDTPATSMGPGTHDNVDQFDRQVMDTTGDFRNDVWEYFTLYPDEATAIGASPADIYDLAPLPAPLHWPRAPFATFDELGLEPGDSIDALLVIDRGTVGGPEFGGPGGQPYLDAALFSLAPGSPSLATYGLSAGDVFFTDFRDTFWLYTKAGEFGLVRMLGGAIGEGDNIDALEIRPPCPIDLDVSDDIGFSDILRIIGAWGDPGGAEDLDNSGVVDFGDVLVVTANWGPCA
jgi:hypothetical protein